MSDPYRFRPTRAGIVNLYEYGDQVFRFSGGRLLLRGHNTSGKTKALELLLPFVLDGDISPRKLDPFAQNAKEMRWNLVGCTDAEQRVGYVWLEFERMVEDGSVQRVTAGVGLRGHRQKHDVARWYFVVHGRRVGEDLSLVRENREPISRNDLVAAIGEDGEVLDRQRDYRERLRDVVFGYAGDEQYRTMLTLMLELRRPHLSKSLEPDGVAELLSAGLPEVDPGLMRKLAGGLEQLEALETGLQRLRRVRDQVRLFHQRTYRAYLRAVLRHRSAALRTADSAFGRGSEAVRDVHRRHEETRRRRARLAEEVAATTCSVERLEGEERALQGSAAWGSVAEVERLRDSAEAQDRTALTLEERVDDEAAAAAALEGEHLAAGAYLEETVERAGFDLDRLAGDARRAGLSDRSGPLDEQLRDGSLSPRSWRELVAELASGRAAILREHGHLLAAVRSAAEVLGRERERERLAGERAAELDGRRDVALDACDRERRALTSSLEGWRAGLRELEPGSDALAAARENAHEGRALRPSFDADVEVLRRTHSDERARLDRSREEVEGELGAVDERRAQLDAEHDDPPPAPPWRTAARDERPGAPLWALVDFARDVDDEQRAALEAALDASGLLDAWIAPDGRELVAGTRDAALVAAAPLPAGPTLADVLEPVAEAAVATEVVREVLRAIALDRGSVSVARDGRFRLGPLVGAAAKPAAEHIGAAARAARRARELERLAREREALELRRGELLRAITAVTARADRLDEELAALPPARAVADALRVAAVATAHAREAAVDHERARARLADAADAEIAARAAAREHALAHGLDVELDEAATAVRREACLRVEASVGGVAQRFDAVASARANLESRAARLAGARRRIETLQTRARSERGQATRLAAEHATRDAALGEEGRETRERFERTGRELREQRTRLAEGVQAERAAAIAAAELGRDVRDAEGALATAREQRATAHTALVRLAVAGLLPLALGEDAPVDHEQAADWPMTRALEVARELPAGLTSATTDPDRLAESVLRGVAELDRELAQADMGAHGAHDADRLLLVQVTDGASVRSLAEALGDLDGDIDERERVLSAEERRVFNDALVEELAEHLRVRIHEVRARVEQMNAVLRRAPTAAGKIVQLEWNPVDDEELRGATAVLRRSARFLAERDRGTVVEFFRRRVELAREAVAEGVPEPMVQTLAGAFDYRRWFAFGLLLEVDGRRERLTKRTHAVGSGGEQSALIHLPLFAAAAALYGDGRGPRLVMLDEALSGIDDDTRERVLAATVAFDLDLVMTSHELWGTYARVPSLAIYQLHRENGVYGVHAVPFLWDGAVLREDEQGELLVG